MTKKISDPGIDLYKEIPKPNIPQSTLNKHWFKILALFLYKLHYDTNTNKLGNEIGKKKPISKRDLCIWLAQKNKPFRAYYMRFKSRRTYPALNQPLLRKKIGLDFYKNVVCDKRKNKEIDLLYLKFKAANKGRRKFYIGVQLNKASPKITKKLI
tara:strand:+ start:825 stop:1289 length:465 start_codon:yes stop_codon:yes gene_type:complete